MYLKQLKLANFKNYSSLDLSFCDNVNCLVGDNGVGKTNLLDAIYYLSFCKSYFNPIDSQNILYGEDFFAIHGSYLSPDEEKSSASCIFRNGQKQMKWNGKNCRTLAEHIGHLPLVMVSPSDQQLITGGSEIRRKFIDGVISQTDNEYLNHLLNYQKAVDQRNTLLKQFYENRSFDESLLALWDEQLVAHGEYIYTRRSAFLKAFTPVFERYFKWIVSDKESPQMVYKPQIEPSTFREALIQNRPNDRYSQHTQVGPHKDDIELDIANHSVKRYGSQGQQKTLLLSLKLAQFEYIYNYCHTKPILLLDDIFDKLDMPRIKQLMALVAGDNFGQVFITDTQPGRVVAIFDEMKSVAVSVFTVANGEVSPLKHLK